MDLSEKISSEDHLSYHPWQQYDPSFARFSCFNGGSSFSASNGASDHTQNTTNDCRDNKKDERCDAAVEFSGDGHENSSSIGGGSDSAAKKRKRYSQDMELDQVQRVENSESNKKGEQNSSKPAGKNVNDGADGAKDQDYIHVRARRGQATNSHSLAERVRREKISERMKFLQDLVPGCSKITGKAVMLEEIINYVQSLQRQVEFLSMKLATVNPRLDANIEGFLSKDLLNLRGGSSSAIGFLPEMIYSQLHPPQQGLVHGGMTNPSDALRRAINLQLTSLGGFKEPLSQTTTQGRRSMWLYTGDRRRTLQSWFPVEGWISSDHTVSKESKEINNSVGTQLPYIQKATSVEISLPAPH